MRAKTTWKKVNGVLRKIRIDKKGKWHFLKGVKGKCPYCGRQRR